MGSLHQGHLKIVERAREESVVSVVTIFVNPTQFGAKEDFDNYPRTLEDDCNQLQTQCVDILFAPSRSEMYLHDEDCCRVEVPKLSSVLCGEQRPTHFGGVTTIVSKLFNIVQPDTAYFGEKDWQQLTIIRHMVEYLDFPIKIEGIETQREDDGLALSSRNQYLTPNERLTAPRLKRTLDKVARSISSEVVDFADLETRAINELKNAGFRPDYVSIRQAHDLSQPTATTNNSELRVFGAAYLGKARLIDNVPVTR